MPTPKQQRRQALELYQTPAPSSLMRASNLTVSRPRRYDPHPTKSRDPAPSRADRKLMPGFAAGSFGMQVPAAHAPSAACDQGEPFFSTFQNTGTGAVGIPLMVLRAAIG